MEVASKALTLAEASDSEAKDYIIKCLSENGRKYAKNPVMVSIYGGQLKTFADSIYDNMKDLNDDKEFATKKVSFVFAKLVKEALESTLVGGKLFESWIQGVAKELTKGNKSLTWTTPDGFKVVLDRKKRETVKLYARVGTNKYTLTINEPTDEIDCIKIKSSISPNLVHSLDATHLRMTTLGSLKEGVTQFNMIHDSIGTNMNDLPIMADVVREQWIELYGGFKVSTDLNHQFQAQSEEVLESCPFLGGYDVSLVLDSEYFFA